MTARAGTQAGTRVKLKKISEAVIEVVVDGVKTVILVGYKLLECVFRVCKEHPDVTISLILILFIGSIFDAIPVIGFLFKEFAKDIGTQDSSDGELKQTIDHEKRRFDNLKTA